jgi:hypothetical protein
VSRFKRLRLSLQLPRTSSLTHHIAPIDRDRLARDVARSIAAQEKSRVSNLFGTAFTLHGDKVFEHGLERLTLTLGLHFVAHRSADQAGANVVDADATGRILKRRALCKADDAVLCGVIRTFQS